ncbi:sulfurtransferase complex subunit TusD [Catenovulum sediminis]|uniref:Sulfurtransferase complex subunit TusD n=1 Tax=Catenovulum sediminis TaxID=1740262 RepID=A0ABV1RH58_9ALTE|nr:sulfurtransferase complex subunit TusD [Catenovulum sediminis]
MARFLLFVTSSPEQQSALSAFQFAKQACQKHQLPAVFFYSDGVYIANELRSPPTDEFDLCQAWQTLAEQYKIELIICSAAAQRRGVLNLDEANYHGKSSYNLATPFRLGGLAEYVELQAQADKVLQF